MAAAAAVGMLVGGCTATSRGSVGALDVPSAVAQAMAAPVDRPPERHTVRGYVVGEISPAGSGTTLSAVVCEAVTRSDPPDCDGRRLRIDNVPDVSSLQARVGELRMSASRCWSNEPLELSGRLRRDGAEAVLQPD